MIWSGETPEVIHGDAGVLFLGTSVHRIVDHLVGKLKPTAQSVRDFGSNLRSRSAYCGERGITYRHVVFPEKACALSDYFPIHGITSFTDHYRHEFTADVIDLQEALSQQRSLFLSTDTHLSFDGMVETTLEICGSLFGKDPEARDALLALRGSEYQYRGDLGGKLDPPILETHVHSRGTYSRRFDNQVGANDGLCIVSFNPTRGSKRSGKRLLVFGDSFMERALPLVSYFYDEVLFCRTRYFHPEMVDMFEPDHVISESAERYFSHVRLDQVAPRFMLMYGVREVEYSRSFEFYRALNAVLNVGTDQHSTFLRRSVLTG